MTCRVGINQAPREPEINPDGISFFKLGKASAMYGQPAQSELDIYERIPKNSREFCSNAYMAGFQSEKKNQVVD